MPVGFQCEPQSGGCGIAKSRRWYGPCPGCQGLYHCKQIVLDSDEREDGDGEVIHQHGVRELGHVQAVSIERVSTGFEGVDLILGTDGESGDNGLALTAGHAVQLFGAPGSAKSTFVLQVCAHVTSEEKLRVLYVAGEEGIEQVKARSDRIRKFNSRMLITEDTDLDRLFHAIQDLQPNLCVIDSLQKITVSGYASGSQAAAVLAASDLCKLAGKRGMALVMINQMNKAGDDFSGAKAVEHSVDTSLFLQLQRDNKTRLLRCDTKNRYGRTPARQYFDMTDAGLVEIEDPSSELPPEPVRDRAGSRLRLAR